MTLRQRLRLLSVSTFLNALACARNQAPPSDIPRQATFDQELSWAILVYFTTNQSSTVGISYELLRKEPTITGLAYPKYYVWVEVRSDWKLVQAGAARLAAFRGSLAVTDFLSAEAIRSDTTTVAAIFPMALIHGITRRARRVHLTPKRGA